MPPSRSHTPAAVASRRFAPSSVPVKRSSSNSLTNTGKRAPRSTAASSSSSSSVSSGWSGARLQENIVEAFPFAKISETVKNAPTTATALDGPLIDKGRAANVISNINSKNDEFEKMQAFMETTHDFFGAPIDLDTARDIFMNPPPLFVPSPHKHPFFSRPLTDRIVPPNPADEIDGDQLDNDDGDDDQVLPVLRPSTTRRTPPKGKFILTGNNPSTTKFKLFGGRDESRYDVAPWSSSLLDDDPVPAPDFHFRRVWPAATTVSDDLRAVPDVVSRVNDNRCRNDDIKALWEAAFSQ